MSETHANPSTLHFRYMSKADIVSNSIANRTGVLSPTNMALVILFAGRNNILLWLTNWSHSTFLLLHRWIAVICVIQACLHSAMYLQSYLAMGEHASESKVPYWIWGIVSTLALCILLPASILQLRKKMYELFLALHIVLAFFAVLGYYYHISLRFGWQWGYEKWTYVAFAFWAFDRLLRVLRIARNGLQTARVTVIDEDYIRLDVPAVVASGQAYLYFPTITWRFWENHPFSIAGNLAVEPSKGNVTSGHEKGGFQVSQEGSFSGESKTASSSNSSRLRHGSGLSFVIRTHTGVTKQLRMRKTVPVLVESSYGDSMLFNQEDTLNAHPSLVCIAGGVGITAVAPILAKHLGPKKLYWGVRTPGLIEALQDIWDDDAYAGVDRHVTIGDRMDLQDILRREITSDDWLGVTVVVSGPATMADEVRVTVANLTKSEKTAVVSFVEESYTW
jgi:NAD(P)H-flavin reductase